MIIYNSATKQMKVSRQKENLLSDVDELDVLPERDLFLGAMAKNKTIIMKRKRHEAKE